MDSLKPAQYVSQKRKNLFAAAIALVTLTGFVATSLISYFVAQKAVVEQITQSTLPLTSDNIYSEIQRDLMRPLFTSSLMAHDTFVRDWALAGEKDVDAMQRYLAEIQTKYQAITSFYVSENTRNYYHSSGLLRKVKEGVAIDEWFFRVKNAADEYEINIDHDTADPTRLTVFINYKVYDFNNNLIGVTGLGLSLEEVQHLIEEYQSKYNRLVYFVNRDGELTLRSKSYHSFGKTFSQPEFKQLIEHEYGQTQQIGFQYSAEGQHVYVNLRYIPEFDWYVAIEQINGDREQQLLDSLYFNITISIIISFFVLTISYLTIAGYQKRLEQMATIDKLSGAYNRHGFDIVFKQNQLQVERNRSYFSGILLDIDFFKKINDSHGHIVGDNIIREVADLLRSQLRGSDILCRWGGEEFLILLPECDLDSAQKLAEKMRVSFTNHAFSHNEELTASFGVAQFVDSECDWIQQLDNALYQAKKSGRNQVVV